MCIHFAPDSWIEDDWERLVDAAMLPAVILALMLLPLSGCPSFAHTACPFGCVDLRGSFRCVFFLHCGLHLIRQALTHVHVATFITGT